MRIRRKNNREMDVQELIHNEKYTQINSCKCIKIKRFNMDKYLRAIVDECFRLNEHKEIAEIGRISLFVKTGS